MEVGIDIIEIDRLDLSRNHFIQRILSDKELLVFNSLKTNLRKKEYLAGRFAAKEAYLKAKHKGIGDIAFKEIEVLNDETGAPYLNDKNAKISISHEKHYACAVVILENT